MKKYWAVSPNPLVGEFDTLRDLRAWAQRERVRFTKIHGHAVAIYLMRRTAKPHLSEEVTQVDG